VGAALLAAALVAVQAVPLAAVAGRLNRGGLSLEESGVASIPPRYLVGLLVADHGGFQEWMTYLGAVVLLLAVVDLLARGATKRAAPTEGGVMGGWAWERWWWAGLALLAAVFSLGVNTPLYGLLYRILPPLGWLRGPGRAWFLVVVAAAVLAARGLTRLEEMRPHARRAKGLLSMALLGVALGGVLGGVAFALPANFVAATVVWPLGGILLALRGGGWLRSRHFAGLALLLALADLWTAGLALYRVRPAAEVLAEGAGPAAWLAARAGDSRVYSPSYSIPQQTGAVYRLETVDGVDPFQLADFVVFMRAATGVELPGYSVTVPAFPEVDPELPDEQEAAEEEEMLLAHRDAVPDLELLGLLGVRYLAAAYPLQVEGLVARGERDGVFLYENEAVFPRAFVVRRVAVAEGVDGALAWLAEHDPRRAAVVEGGPPLEGEAGAWAARVVERTPNRVTVEAEGPGLLVLSEVYDPDWRAAVDGESARMVRADGVLRGVHLDDAGVHRVTFTYRPVGLGVGCGVTAAGLVCLVVLWVLEKRRGIESN
jgi:hypothetical protein